MIAGNYQQSNSYPKNFKREACPVCNNLDARCKPGYGDSILCWNTSVSEVETDIWHIVADIDRGTSGMRGVMVAPKRDAAADPVDVELLEFKREQARKQRSLELANLPTVESRNKGYRQILASLPLIGTHKIQLQKRGLADSEIDQAISLNWFATWKAGVECQENLAGVDPATDKTRWLGGMFISAIDAEGRILGGQIASDNPGVVGKYFWVSSKKVGGYGCQLPHTGDMPLFVRKHPHSTKTTEIWLLEGGLKSGITALKLWHFNKDVVVIGTAMSARFGEQLAEILRELNPEVIRILPDAGTTRNFAILSGVLQTAERVKRLGHTPRIGWWGQYEKGKDLDIDDYLAQEQPLAAIKWLSISEFVSLTDERQLAKKNDDLEAEKPAEETQKKRVPLPKFVDEIAARSYRKYTAWEPPDTSIDGNILTRQPKLATDWEYLENGGEHYDQSWEFYPPRSGEILFIKAGTGQGKSHLIAHWMNEYYKNKGCIFLGYRNGLLHQQCSKVDGLEHLRGADSDGFLRLLDPYYRSAFCDASLHNMRGSYASEKILVLDEVMSIIASLLLGSTCSRNRRSRLDIFAAMLVEADMIVCLDAHLENWCVDLLTTLARNKTVRKMQNIWEDKPRSVKLVVGTETNPADKNQIRTEILESKEQKIAVFSDSQHELETLHELLLKSGVDDKTIVRIDSTTSGEPWCIELLKNIDKHLENNPQVKILLVSPSGDSGLDISSVYFEKVFLILCGTLTINSALQMYGRVRDRDVPRVIFCAKDAQFRIEGNGFTKGAIASDMALSIEQQIRLITDGVTQTEDLKDILYRAVKKWQDVERSDMYAEAVSILLAKDNFEKLHYRDLFVMRLQELGDEVEIEYGGGEVEIKKDFQEVSLSVKYAEAAKLVSAEDISDLQAESYRKKDINPEQLLALKKYDFKKRLPGIQLDQDLAKTLLYDRHFLSELEQRYYLSHPDIALSMARIKWSYAIKNTQYFTSDLRSRISLRTDCLNRLGLLEFLDDRDWLENGKEVKILRQRWDELKKHYGSNLRNILGFDWDKQQPILTVYKLLALVGCDLRILKAKGKAKKNSPKVRRITYGSLNDPTRLAILTSFDKRFEDLKSVDWEEVKAVCENVLEVATETPTD